MALNHSSVSERNVTNTSGMTSDILSFAQLLYNSQENDDEDNYNDILNTNSGKSIDKTNL